MDGKSVCEVCGNELDPALATCPFCNQTREPVYTRKNREHFSVVNLELGMPLVHGALKRLDYELASADQRGIKIFILIHGYGSSGKGGAIKDAVRKVLKLRKDQSLVNDVLPGEDCGKQSTHAKFIQKRFPMVKEYLLRPNPGITLVVI